MKPSGSKKLSKDEMEELHTTLGTLAANPNYEVWVMSARPLDNLRQVFGEVPNLRLAGSYGVELGSAGGSDAHRIVEIPEIEALRSHVQDVFNYPNVFRPKDSSFSVSFGYEGSKTLNEEKVEELLSSVRTYILEHQLEFEVSHKPDTQWVDVKSSKANKETGARYILDRAFSRGISFGDEPADEGMHKAMNELGFWSVVVGPNTHGSAATHKLPSYVETNEFLKEWANSLSLWKAVANLLLRLVLSKLAYSVEFCIA
ncbi:hypothetical protein O181_040485 [Austropuccinia psidii MF-1]|uniref:Trehalose 6-phosphate phosphatase n=1 Tax=Austropuccinia psidii MF-1 TaxID=1389203 RepID=A0A9Q3HG68_9BASI|nr:hypothetical protein [Austropuccinia psidii MF-1]